MKKEHKEILEVISKYLEENPEQRFWQALFNLWINEFADKSNPEAKDFLLKDIYNDRDSEIVSKIKKITEKKEVYV